MTAAPNDNRPDADLPPALRLREALAWLEREIGMNIDAERDERACFMEFTFKVDELVAFYNAIKRAADEIEGAGR